MAKYLIGEKVKSGISVNVETASVIGAIRAFLHSGVKVPLYLPEGGKTFKTFTKSMTTEESDEIVNDMLFAGFSEEDIKVVFGYSSQYNFSSCPFLKDIHVRLGKAYDYHWKQDHMVGLRNDQEDLINRIDKITEMC